MSVFSLPPGAFSMAPPPVATPSATGVDPSLWSDIGWASSLMGTALSAVGSYYGVEAQKGQLAQQAANADHAAAIARINAQGAESNAQAVLRAGQLQRMGLTLQQAQDRGRLVAGQAASGASLGGTGSLAEARASQRLLQRIDAMTQDSNTLRAAQAARMQGVNAQNEALLANASAQNIRGTAGSLNPWMAGIGSGLESVGGLASQWVYRERYRGGRA